MPYVNVRILAGATRAQKARLVADITASLVDVLGKRPEHTHVVIDEVDPANWGFAGRPTSELLRREAAAARRARGRRR